MIQLIVLTACALGAVYFIFYRPTVAREQRQRRVVAGLRVGDQVVTTTGFNAPGVDVREPEDGTDELMLDLGDGKLVRARPSAVEDRLPRPDELDGDPADAPVAAVPDEALDDDAGPVEQPVPAGVTVPVAGRASKGRRRHTRRRARA
jgi:preprotein translocase subunit YajC